MEFTGEVYKAKSEKWAFVLRGRDGETYGYALGYATEQVAKVEMQKLLAELSDPN